MTDIGGSALEEYARGRIGTTLRAKYRLDAVIGLGGMAVVYKATHRNQAEFAVKMLHPELSLREDVRTRFVREGYAANSVKHPGVVLVVDDDVADDGAAFIVMELLDGLGCEKIWEKCGGRMPVKPTCSVGFQLLDVLASAHAKGIVHRDLKPANMFVTREGRVKVLDFGIARVRDVATTNATATGMLLGTPAFMGPEQALAKTTDIDAQTDVWAVGATLFTMLSGALVHEAENAQQILIKAATQKARSLATAAPHVPKEIIAVVDRALSFDKVDRWPDAAAMRDALAKACKDATGERPSMDSLAMLAGGDAAVAKQDHRSPAAIAETVAATSRSPPASTPAPKPAAIAPTVNDPTLPLPPRSAPQLPAPAVSAPVVSAQLMGMSTAKPVSTDRPPSPPPLSRPPPAELGGTSSNRRPMLLVSLGVAAIVGLGGLLTNALSKRSAEESSNGRAQAEPSSASSPASPPPAAEPPPPTATTSAPAVTNAPLSSAIAEVKPAPAKPVAVVAPAKPPVSATPSAAAPPSAKASATAAPSAGPKCRQVETVDTAGEHHFKKVCD